LGERDRPEQPPVLHPVADAPGDAAEHDGRAEQREEEPGQGQGRAGLRLDVQRERYPEQEVAEGGEAYGTDDQAYVAEAEDGRRRQLRPRRCPQRAASVNAA
jgi:hypothetical protein